MARLCWGCVQGGRLGVGTLTNCKEHFQNMYSNISIYMPKIPTQKAHGPSVLVVCAGGWALLRTWP